MTSQILYSVNPFLKYFLQETYMAGVHFVWVSELFDSRISAGVNPPVPPTSNPKDIYLTLKRAVEEEDEHDYKIKEQKVLIKARAIEWAKSGSITTDQRDDIIYTVDNGSFKQWRPLIYVIPMIKDYNRIVAVERSSRASLRMEYKIENLSRSEFDVIEP